MPDKKPGPSSMTGFARQEAQYEWGQLICEIRSVNHRYLEPAIRLPEVLRRLEPQIRESLRKQLSRGKLEVSLHLKRESAELTEGAINQEAASSLLTMLKQLDSKLENPAPTSSIDILRWPGVLQAMELDQDLLQQVTMDIFKAALTQLQDMRRGEGAELANMIEQRLANISESVDELRRLIPEIMQQQRNKLRERIDALNIDVDEERFTQEVVYMAQKSDVDEELDRLEAHVAEVRATLQKKEPIGRRLDFLMQELNREANTLASKSIASDCSQAAVNLKVWIEQMREQVQNIE